VTVLSNEELTKALQELHGWSLVEATLRRTFSFRDFVEAMHFVNSVAAMAEAMEHHPDIDIRYNKVSLTLTTHDAGGLTSLDVTLAHQANGL